MNAPHIHPSTTFFPPEPAPSMEVRLAALEARVAALENPPGPTPEQVAAYADYRAAIGSANARIAEAQRHAADQMAKGRAALNAAMARLEESQAAPPLRAQPPGTPAS